MKTTIFTRILIATLLPVFLVLLIVIITARNIIYQDGAAYAGETVRLAAKQISDQMSNKLELAAILQNDIGKEMARIDFRQPEARQTIDRLLDTFLLSNHDLYSVWFAFEPGVFPGSARYYRTLLREADAIRAGSGLSDAVLRDSAASPWYHIPLSTGTVYTNVCEYPAFASEGASAPLFTITYPIITEAGEIVGCLGLGVKYGALFPADASLEAETQRIMLVSADGVILFTDDGRNIGSSLQEYGFAHMEAVLGAILQNEIWQAEISLPSSGEKMLSCLYPVEIPHAGQTLFLLRGIPAGSLYSSFYPSLEVILITGAFGMILLAFCVFFSTRGIVGHVKRITDGFNRVATDGAEVTLKGEHIPTFETNVLELDILQSALVSMMVQLRRAHGIQLEAVEAEVEKEKLIASAQAKANFFAAMSHEIRTPMNAILGISEILLHEGNLSAQQERYVQDIKISSDALLNIINDILDISKLETGKMELHPEHYNFRALLDNIASLSTHLSEEANLKFFFRPDDNLPLCLYGDGTRLRQILLNLVGNAIKFTREGYVLLRVFAQETKLCFHISDTGIGIRESELASIFEPFRRVDTRRNRDVKGTGLGLSISQNLVALMGGTISVESAYGKGSLFIVTLPLVPGDEKKLLQKKHGRSKRYSDSLRVLVVDDNEINLNVSSGLLQAAHGIRCDTASSGREAIAKVQETDYDIVFMDYMMPELDGVDTTQCIRRLGEKYQKLPIIALTANAVIGTKSELLSGGLDDFLSKPIQRDSLREILDTWVPESKRLPDDPGEPADDPGDTPADTPGECALPMAAILEAAGVDMRAGLENIGLDHTMYTQSLRLLGERIPETIKRMGSLLEQENAHELQILVHGLKGSLASIGAAALSDDAKRVELALMNESADSFRTLLPPLFEKLERLRAALDSALAAGQSYAWDAVSDASYGEGTENQPERMLQRLYRALESYDYEAVTNALGDILAAGCGEEAGDLLSQLKSLIESFDYPGALALLRDAR